jgi:hypothetical protein
MNFGRNGPDVGEQVEVYRGKCLLLHSKFITHSHPPSQCHRTYAAEGVCLKTKQASFITHFCITGAYF